MLPLYAIKGDSMNTYSVFLINLNLLSIQSSEHWDGFPRVKEAGM